MVSLRAEMARVRGEGRVRGLGTMSGTSLGRTTRSGRIQRALNICGQETQHRRTLQLLGLLVFGRESPTIKGHIMLQHFA